MTFKKGKLKIYVPLFSALLTVSPLRCAEKGQIKRRSASDLTQFLTYKSDRPRGSLRLQFDCGRTEEDRENLAAGNSLVQLGMLAIPDLERELELIERLGMESKPVTNAPLLLNAYARIKGPAALSKLRRLIGRRGLAYLSISLDSSIALSLGLTSYVSDSREPVTGPRCERPEEPRDALDRLIISWASGDRHLFEAQLGPAAILALNSLLEGRTWAGLRADLWHAKSEGGVSVGYRFSLQGRWSAPEDLLKSQLAVAPHSVNPQINTEFTTGSGTDCGWLPINFLSIRFKQFTKYYVVDNTNLVDLLRLVNTCAGS